MALEHLPDQLLLLGNAIERASDISSAPAISLTVVSATPFDKQLNSGGFDAVTRVGESMSWHSE